MVRAEFSTESKQHTITVTASSLSRAQELAEEAVDQPVRLMCPLNSSFFAGDAQEEIDIHD